MGRYSSILRSPKKEEQQVPDNSVPELPDINDIYPSVDEIDIMDELEDIWGTEDEEKLGGDGVMFGVSERNFLDWDELPIDEGEDQKTTTTSDVAKVFWEDEQEKIVVNLKLNLNYQKVMDAWSGRGSLWADDCSHSTLNNNFMGEVPVMQEERSRREARVLRYREKRQNRLFSNSKKIRYQVRKINAESRPRLKGRFVKRIPDKMHR